MMGKKLEEELQWILSLGDNWDGEGAIACSDGMVDRVSKFMLDFQQRCRERHQLEIGEPTAKPGPDGGIDLRWKTDKYDILLYVPSLGSPRYYGRDPHGGELKGSL